MFFLDSEIGHPGIPLLPVRLDALTINPLELNSIEVGRVVVCIARRVRPLGAHSRAIGPFHSRGGCARAAALPVDAVRIELPVSSSARMPDSRHVLRVSYNDGRSGRGLGRTALGRRSADIAGKYRGKGVPMDVFPFRRPETYF